MGTVFYFQLIQTVQGGKPSLCSALKFLIISPVVAEVDIFLHSFTHKIIHAVAYMCGLLSTRLKSHVFQLCWWYCHSTFHGHMISMGRVLLDSLHTPCAIVFR